MSGGQQTTGSTQPTLPSELAPMFNQSINSWLSGMNAAPGAGLSLPQLLQPNPEQIAPLTSAQMSDINQLQGFAQTGAPGEQQAMDQLAQLTGGAIGSSPATAAAMRAYTQNVQPTIESSLAATGGGRGGELTAALTQGQTSAYAPLVQQEIQNRLSAVPLYSQLAGQRSGDVTTALNAAGQVQQTQQAQNTANFQDFLRRSGLAQELQLGPVSSLGPGLLGSGSTSISTPGKF